MEELGTVINIIDTKAVIQKSDTSSCSSCNIKSICNYKHQKEFTIENTENFKVGDTVQIIITPSQRLFASFIAYILPLILFFMLYYIFSQLFKLNELLTILFSLLWIPFWVLIMRHINQNNKHLQVKIEHWEAQK